MEAIDKERVSCISILKSLIAPEKGGMKFHLLEPIYASEVGSRIPYQKFGFQSLTAFLTSVPEINLDNNQFLHVRDPKMAHITAMVEAQKSNKSRKGRPTMRGKRPAFPSGGRTARPSYLASSSRPYGSSSSYSFPTKKTSYAVTQAKKPTTRYNPAPSLLSKMPTVEYVNGVAIHKPPTTEYNNNSVTTGAYPKTTKPEVYKPATVNYNQPKPSSPKKSVQVVNSSTPTRKTTIEYVNGVATTYIDGVAVKKAPIYNSPEHTTTHNGVGKTGNTEIPKTNVCTEYNGEPSQMGGLSLEVNGRRRMIARPAHTRTVQSDMRDIEERLRRTQLNDRLATGGGQNEYVTIEQRELASGRQQNGNAARYTNSYTSGSSDWQEKCPTKVVPDYASGDATANACRDYQASSTSAQAQALDSAHQTSSSNETHNQRVQEAPQQVEAAAVQLTPQQVRLSRVHQRLRGINRPRDRVEVPEAPQRSVVLQSGNGLLTISVDNVSCHSDDVVAAPAPPATPAVVIQPVNVNVDCKLETLRLTLRPIFAGHQLIGDNFFLGLAKTPEINAPCTAIGGKDFRSGLCISGLTVMECCQEVYKTRVMSNKVAILLGAMDVLAGKDFTELKIQAIGLMELLLDKAKMISIVLCTIPPLLTATESQRCCQLEFNKWIRNMVQGSRLFSCCDLFAKFLTTEPELPINDRLYAREPTCIDVDDDYVKVYLWNKEGCSQVLEELKTVCR